MSRTYRRSMINLDRNDQPFIPRKFGYYYSEGEYWEHSKTDYYSKHNQKFDCKPWGKAPKWYKTMKKRIRKSKERNALRNFNFGSFPLFKKTDAWDWS